ncbi:hypothetical protein SK803_29935 [Lentzea sp. BCCO 10_0856]|uniref:TIGR04222 domain-containing protein n=1 Tax=Lentzea miocenica TaxID=3095431 RepID=A0ABU4T8G5_9PSEU|nr:hypothetical protein [Lentzea sp. BCCO 10_0856]MDX8034459.1 hypothetical protein [Lentzea sp. BCCO 10_0856]
MRMLIWTPLNAAELQKAMHSGNIGPAALVPVQSGTVLLPPPATRLNEAAYMTNRVRKLAGGAALAAWNDDAALLYLFTTALGRASMWGSREAVLRLSAAAKQSRGAGKLFDRSTAGLINMREKEKWQLDAIDKLTAMYPPASRKGALERIRDFENGAGAIPEFFRAAGLEEVARVAELTEQGRADFVLQTLEPPRAQLWPLAAVFPLIVLTALVTVLLHIPMVVYYLIAGVLVALMAGVIVMLRRRLVRRKPINAVLPVIPVTQGAAPTD